jgi:hypothetical protein
MLVMRKALVALLLAVPATHAVAQNATVIGAVVLKEGGQPLGFATVSVLSQGTQLLTGETGRFMLLNLPPGQVRLRFKRIGFSPKDTTLTVAANDTARVRLEMTRLVIQLPAMLVSGACTNEAPRQAQPQILADLFEQVKQNAEQSRLLASQKPFLLHVYRIQGIQNGTRLTPTRIDTVTRTVERIPYVPSQVVSRGEGVDADSWVLHLPDLADFADTAFTNHHCFRYAGQTRWESDSVIQVDYEPVPWLAKETDVEGTMYLRVNDYQLVGTITKLNRIPRQFWTSGLAEVTVHARFGQLVAGIPTLDEWLMSRRFRRDTRVETGQVFRLQWLDSTATRPDTTLLLRLRDLPRLRP